MPALRPQNLPGDGRLPRRRSPLTARTYVAPHPTARTHQSPRLHVVTCRPQAHKRRNKVGSMRNVHRPRNRSCSDSVPRGHDAWHRFQSTCHRRVRVTPRRCRQVSGASGPPGPVAPRKHGINEPLRWTGPTTPRFWRRLFARANLRWYLSSKGVPRGCSAFAVASERYWLSRTRISVVVVRGFWMSG